MKFGMKIWKGGSVSRYVEGSDSSVSNWMRFVNCADCEEQQNVVAFQFKGKIYYRTYKTVMQYTEILVWYGDGFGKELGICRLRNTSVETAVENGFEGHQCEVCHVLFATKEYLERHRRSHPHQGHDLKHRCPHCAYSTSDSTSLRNHLLTHTKERPHQCSHCSRAFTEASNLRRHLVIHTGENPFQCEECGKKFNNPSNLRKHERIHIDLREWVCATCGKGFSQKMHLVYHDLIHTGQKPHKCQRCEYRARDVSTLRVHVISAHSKEYPHVCPVCGKGFVKPVCLKQHTVKKHGGDRAESH